jgi:predicted enzyme related to lactoylglutathione lyase
VEVPSGGDQATRTAHGRDSLHCSDDVERSRRFYTEILGGTVAFGPEPTNIALANTWIIINRGGGPTDDKPTVVLQTPSDPNRVSSFLNIRVEDIHAAYTEWSARGGAVSDAANAAQVRDPMLHTRSRRLQHRGGSDHRSARRLVACRVATDPLRWAIGLNRSHLLASDPDSTVSGLLIFECPCARQRLAQDAV